MKKSFSRCDAIQAIRSESFTTRITSLEEFSERVNDNFSAIGKFIYMMGDYAVTCEKLYILAWVSIRKDDKNVVCSYLALI